MPGSPTLAFVGSALAAFLAFSGSPKISKVVAVPAHHTAVSDLAPNGFTHAEILRIKQRGFHSDDNYDIALDGWVSDTRPDAIADLRMWWVNTGKRNERSPFGKGVTRHLDIGYHPRAKDRWELSIRRGKKRWVFEVRLEDGQLSAYGKVKTRKGTVDGCRAAKTRMVPSRTLGLLTGIDRLDVTCVGPDGMVHRGQLVPR